MMVIGTIIVLIAGSLAIRHWKGTRPDPETPFIPTSPIMGVGHGHYIFYDAATGEEVFQVMRRADNTAYTEFGMPGMASSRR